MAQIIYCLLSLWALLNAANKHGKTQPLTNFWATLVATIIIISLLWWGGFWDCWIK